MIAILGGGIVGHVCQRICEKNNWPYTIFAPPAPEHKKLLLLNQQSVDFLTQLGFDIPTTYTYTKLKALQHRRFSRLLIEDAPVCYGVYSHHLQQALHDSKNAIPELVQSIALHENSITLQTQSDSYEASYLLGCDGQQSLARKTANISLSYRNPCHIICMPANIEGDSLIQLQHKLYSLAALPGENGMLIICSKTPLEPESVTTSKLQQILKHHCYLVHAKPTISYQIRPSLAQTCYRNRCLLLGNAALNIEPIAAQGLNHALFNLKKLYNTPNIDTLQLQSLSDAMQKQNQELYDHMAFLSSTKTSSHFAKQLILSTNIFFPDIKERLLKFGNRHV